MNFQLLLVDGHGNATVAPLRIRTLREFPGQPGLSVHFRPVRQDPLFESARIGGQLAYRILFGEGVIRSQLWVEYELSGEQLNIAGRSSDLLFALALLTSAWPLEIPKSTCIAATGVVDGEGNVQGVDHTVEKLGAAVRAHGDADFTLVFYPAVDRRAVQAWCVTNPLPPGVRLVPVATLEEALACLGYVLEKVYLQNPFCGLKYFDYEHRAIFFGRDREIREVVQQLLRRESAAAPGLLIEGPSGTGKSSLLRAGVLPALADARGQPEAVRASLRHPAVSRGIRRAIWRPGLLVLNCSESAIAQSIQSCWVGLPELEGAWPGEPVESLTDLALRRRTLWPVAARFVWMIDQFEEIFTLGLGDALIAIFGKFLLQLQCEGVWTLVCIRTDALTEMKRHDALRQVFGANEGQYYLATLSGTMLDEVITLPARATDLTFGLSPDGKSLDQLLREEAYREPDSLPLLQFTLNELYQRRTGKVLSFDVYQRLGGLAGSIATTAQSVLRTGTPAERNTQARLFRSLVSVDEGGHATRRYAPLAEIAADEQQQMLIRRLVEARLCVSDVRDGQAVVAFAHDSLLRTLPALVEWLREESGLLQTRELVQRETRLWQQHGESSDWLATSDKLVAYKALAAADMVLPDSVRSFLNSSAQRTRRITRLKRAVVATITVLAVAASIGARVAATKQREAEHQTALTLAAQKRSLTEAAAARLKDGELAYARGIVLEVLKDSDRGGPPDAAAVNVFQELRAADPLRVVLAGHEGAVRNVAFSRDGARIITGSLDGTARLWDTRTGAQLSILQRVKDRAVMFVSYSPDGTRILTSAAGIVSVWDARDGHRILALSDPKGDVGSGVYAPDGQRIVTYFGKHARVWDAHSGKLLATLPEQPGDVYFTLYAPGGRQILTLQRGKFARVLDARTGTLLASLKGHTQDVIAAAYAPDGSRIVTGSQDGTVRIWNARTGAQLRLFPVNVGQVWGVAWSPDGNTIATGATDKKVRIWDAAAGVVLRVLTGHGDILGGVAFSPDGLSLASAGYDLTARVWDLRAGRETAILHHSAQVASVNYSPDGAQVVTGSQDRATRIWDVRSGAPIRRLGSLDEAVGCASYSHDGGQIVTSSGGVAKLWDAATGNPVRTMSVPDGVRCALFSPDDRRVVASMDDYPFETWDAATGLASPVWPDKTDGVNTASYSPDQNQVVTASTDGTARIWDAHSGTQLAILAHKDHVNAAVYSPDGSRILTASSDNAARVWDARTGALQLTLIGHHTFVFDAAFSSDGRRIVTTSKDNTVRIWDAQRGTQLAVLPGHTDVVWSARFSPDGTQVASSSRDMTARLWDATMPSDLATQILWEQAANPDPLKDVEVRQLGLVADTTGARHFAPTSRCAEQAAAYYDPDRRSAGMAQEQINADIASAACTEALANSEPLAQHQYLVGRASLAKGDLQFARSRLQAAVAAGYRAAAVDLADLLSRSPAQLSDLQRAIVLYEHAWERRVPIAAFRLARLYEARAQGADAARAREWYQKGAALNEPTALGRLAQMKENDALLTQSSGAADALLLEAFRLYARAAEQARAAGWPDEVWKIWRYRRASLARVLANEHMMQAVAEAYQAVRAESVPGPPGALESYFGQKD